MPDGGDGTCRDCRLALAGEHPDVREVERTGAGDQRSTRRARSRTLASRTPVEGDRKVLILHEFHLLRDEAAAALLKTIEEPPASTVFVILADDVPPELVTIASRCAAHRLPAGARTTSSWPRSSPKASPPTPPTLAADAAAGDLDRARLLAADPELAARRAAFHRLPTRLDGTGAAVTAATDELLGLIDGAAAAAHGPPGRRGRRARGAVPPRSASAGAIASELEDRHQRELRRHRTDELQVGPGRAGGGVPRPAGRRHAARPGRRRRGGPGRARRHRVARAQPERAAAAARRCCCACRRFEPFEARTARSATISRPFAQIAQSAEQRTRNA